MKRQQFIVQDHKGHVKSFAMDVNPRQSQENMLRQVAELFAKKHNVPKMEYISVKEKDFGDWIHFQVTN